MAFVYTPNGYFPLSDVELVKIKKDGKRELWVGGKVVDDDSSPENVLTSIIPVQGDWECLAIGEGEDGKTEIISEPVLAWGLTAFGRVLPVTASENSGVDGHYGLRRAGEEAVYGGSMGGYVSSKDWIEANS